jgi:selenoprotein W-related protein
VTETLLKEFEPNVQEWTLIPGGNGVFEVIVNGDLVYSKARTGRHPEIGELRKAIRGKLG